MNPDLIYLYYLLIGLAITFYIIGYSRKDVVFTLSSGILLIISAISLMTNGFPDIDNPFLIIGGAVCLTGIGMYLIITAGYSWMQNDEVLVKDDEK